jgi:hypothetical protein
MRNKKRERQDKNLACQCITVVVMEQGSLPDGISCLRRLYFPVFRLALKKPNSIGPSSPQRLRDTSRINLTVPARESFRDLSVPLPPARIVLGLFFFFFESEFVFRSAYNVAQRRSCSYYTVCLGVWQK